MYVSETLVIATGLRYHLAMLAVAHSPSRCPLSTYAEYFRGASHFVILGTPMREAPLHGDLRPMASLNSPVLCLILPAAQLH